jgi:hypothetical protein
MIKDILNIITRYLKGIGHFDCIEEKKFCINNYKNVPKILQYNKKIIYFEFKQICPKNYYI